MTNKLISNLSFSPSAVEQLGFYARRLKREESIRRVGLVMVILSMLVQVLAVSFPAERSLAYSDNHILNGVRTKRDILQAWDRPGSDIAAIYGKFGVTRKDIADLPNQPNATINSNGNNFWSTGRNSLSGYSNIEQRFKDQEIALRAGSTPIYLRPLKAWDAAGTSSNYKAFRGRNSTTGETFWILIDCGNYTQIGKGSPPRPELQVKKSIVGNPSTVKPGDSLKFRIEYRNKQVDSLAENVALTDNLEPAKYDLVSQRSLARNRGQQLEKPLGNLQFTDHSRVFDFDVRLKNNLKNGTRVCNNVRLTSSNAIPVNDSVCATVSDRAIATNAVTVTSISSPSSTSTTIPPGLSKEVKNLNRNLSGDQATEFAVRPNHKIEYALTTTNSNSHEIVNYTIQDYVGDLLDYADIDLDYLASQGGIYDASSKQVIWQDATLPAGSDTIKKFRIQIKDPIPTTNSPSKLTTNYDCKISNEYGEEITMRVECPFVKNVETLPNTGPGASLGFAFAATLASGYFMARSRLLSKELTIAKRIFPSAGGSL